MTKSISTILLSCLVFYEAFASGNTSVSSDGRYIASGYKKNAGVLDWRMDTLAFTTRLNYDIVGSGFSQDDKVVVFQDEYYTFYAYDLNGKELWISNLSDVVDVPDKLDNNHIVFSKSGNYIMQIEGTSALIIDRWSGDIIGFQDFKNYRRNRAVPRSFEGDTFEFGSSSQMLLTVNGYGDLTFNLNKSVSYENYKGGYVGDWHNGQYCYADGQELNWQIFTNESGKAIAKKKTSVIDGSFNGIYSADGKLLTIRLSNDYTVLQLPGPKKKKSFSANAGYFVHLDNNILVTRGIHSQQYFEIHDVKSGKQIKSIRAETKFQMETTSVVKSASTKEAGVIFYDEFDDNFNEWAEGTSDVTSKKFVSGKYILSTEDGMYSTWCNKIRIDPFRDFEVEYKVKVESTDEDTEFGVFWDRNYEHSNYHAMFIKPKGEAWVGRYLRGKWRNDHNYSPVPSFKKGDFNVLKVRKEGLTISHYINDEKVYEEPFTGFYGNKVGFVYQKTMTVDYIKVSYLSENFVGDIPIYNETFVDNSRGWVGKSNSEKYIMSLEDGAYRYETPSSSSFYRSNLQFFIDEGQNYELEVAIKYESSTNDKLAGIVWGGATKSTDRYRFGFSPSGSLRVDKYANGAWKAIQNWTKAVKIDPKKYNRLKIVKFRGQYKFYVNNELVALEGYRTNDEYLSFGPKVGIQIPGNSVIKVDYIKAKYWNFRHSNHDTYYEKTGKSIYIPFLRYDEKGAGGNTLVGRAIHCKKRPKSKMGGMGLATTTSEIYVRYMRVDEPDEVEWMRREIGKMHGRNGKWFNWDHNINCK